MVTALLTSLALGGPSRAVISQPAGEPCPLTPAWQVVDRVLDSWCVLEGEGPLPPGAVLDPRITFVSPHPDAWALESQPTLGALLDADVDAETAWSVTRGAGVTVAVVDTGVMLDHPGLAHALWTNPGEIAGNGIDDDANGFIDDIHGANIPRRSGDPTDTVGHGTACAGLIVGTDALGSLGLAPAARLLAVNIEDDAAGFASTAAEGIVYAVDAGADIISASWVIGQTPSPVLDDALDYAAAAGVLVVAAAGNVGHDADALGFFPARSTSEAVLAVSASDRADARIDLPGFLEVPWGASSIDLLAPGLSLETTADGGGRRPFDGTSAAAALTAGAAALVRSAHPDLDLTALRALLLSGVDPTGSETVSGGRLNAGNAVLARSGLRLDITRDGEAWTVAEPADWEFPTTDEVPTGNQVTQPLDWPGPWTVTATSQSALGRYREATDIDWESSTARWRDGELEDDAVWLRLAYDDLETPIAIRDQHDVVVASLDTAGRTPPLRGPLLTVAEAPDAVESWSPRARVCAFPGPGGPFAWLVLGLLLSRGRDRPSSS